MINKEPIIISRNEIIKAIFDNKINVEKYDYDLYAIHISNHNKTAKYSFVIYDKKYSGNILDNVEDIYEEINSKNWLADIDRQEIYIIFNK